MITRHSRLHAHIACRDRVGRRSPQQMISALCICCESTQPLQRKDDSPPCMCVRNYSLIPTEWREKNLYIAFLFPWRCMCSELGLRGKNNFIWRAEIENNLEQEGYMWREWDIFYMDSWMRLVKADDRLCQRFIEVQACAEYNGII